MNRQRRKSFEREREVRVLVQRLPHEGQPSSKGERYDTARRPEPGIRLEVDLNRLVEAVYVAPATPGWLVKSVEALAEKYQLAAHVRQSSLMTGAIF